MENEKRKFYLESLIKIFNNHKQVDEEVIKNLYIEIPNKLYKYRESTPINITTLKNKKIYCNSISKWEDQLDTCVKLKDDEHYISPENKILEGDIIEQILSFKDTLFTYKTVLGSANELAEILGLDVKKFTNIDDKKECVAELMKISQKLKNFGKSMIISTPKAIKNHVTACSMSETYSNSKQWSEYSDHGKGFCIEYDIKKIFRPNIYDLSKVVPVYYSDDISVSTSEILNKKPDTVEDLIPNAKDLMAKFYLPFLTKEKCYESENEWRIFGPESKEGAEIDFNCASAIYLGEKITQENKEILIEIAEKQNIPVYQRELNEILGKWEYKLLS